jgi:hypothetical protein
MFHFPTFPPRTLCVQMRVTAHDCCRVSPFGHPRIEARLAAPRGLSQPPTSFIGSWCLGIHRVPLITWPQRFKDARVHCAVLKVRAVPDPLPPPTQTTPEEATHAVRVEDPVLSAPTPPTRRRSARTVIPVGPEGGNNARSLRTQQRVLRPPRPRTRFPHPEGLYSRPAHRARPNWSAFHP